MKKVDTKDAGVEQATDDEFRHRAVQYLTIYSKAPKFPVN